MAGNTSNVSELFAALAPHNNVRLQDAGPIRAVHVERDTTMIFPFWRVAAGNQASFITEINNDTYEVPATDTGLTYEHLRANSERVKINWNPVLLSGYQAVTEPAGSGLRELDNYTGFNQGGGIEAISRTLTRGSAGVIARGSLVPPILPMVKLLHFLVSLEFFNNTQLLLQDTNYVAFCDTLPNLRPNLINSTRSILYGRNSNGTQSGRDVGNYAGYITYNRFCKQQFSRDNMPVAYFEALAEAQRSNALIYVPYFSSAGMSLAQEKAWAMSFTGLNISVCQTENALGTDNGYGAVTAFATYQMPNGSVVYPGDQEGRFLVNGRLIIFVDMDNDPTKEFITSFAQLGTFEQTVRALDSAEIPGLLGHLALLLGDASEVAYFHAGHTAHYRVPHWVDVTYATTQSGFYSTAASLVRTIQPLIAPPALRTGSNSHLSLPYSWVDAIHFAYARPWTQRRRLSTRSMFAALIIAHFDVQTKLVHKMFELNEDLAMRYAGQTALEAHGHKFAKYLDGTLAHLSFGSGLGNTAIDVAFATPVPYLPADWLPKYTTDAPLVRMRRLNGPAQIVYTRHFVFAPINLIGKRLTTGNDNADGFWPVVRMDTPLRDRNLAAYVPYYPVSNNITQSIVCFANAPVRGVSQEDDLYVRSFRHGQGPATAPLAVGDWTF